MEVVCKCGRAATVTSSREFGQRQSAVADSSIAGLMVTWILLKTFNEHREIIQAVVLQAIPAEHGHDVYLSRTVARRHMPLKATIGVLLYEPNRIRVIDDWMDHMTPKKRQLGVACSHAAMQHAACSIRRKQR